MTDDPRITYWMVTNPRGSLVVYFARQRDAAIRRAFDPPHNMAPDDFATLLTLHASTPDFAKLEHNGWTVLPHLHQPTDHLVVPT